MGPSFAAFYNQDAYRGYYYFDDPAANEAALRQVPKTPEEAAYLMAKKQEKLYQLRCLAILNPTPDHVKNYLRNHKETLALSSTFTTEWMHAILQNPELGAAISNPSTSFGVNLKKQIDQLQKSDLLSFLKTKYFLLVIGEGGDPWSEKAAEVARDFAAITGFVARFGTLNHKKVAAFEEAFPIQNLVSAFKAKKFPAFFILHPETKKGYPVGTGALSIVDLIDNISFQAKRHSLDQMHVSKASS